MIGDFLLRGYLLSLFPCVALRVSVVSTSTVAVSGMTSVGPAYLGIDLHVLLVPSPRAAMEHGI